MKSYLVLVHQQDFLMEYVIQCALSVETIFKLNSMSSESLFFINRDILIVFYNFKAFDLFGSMKILFFAIRSSLRNCGKYLFIRHRVVRYYAAS